MERQGVCVGSGAVGVAAEAARCLGSGTLEDDAAWVPVGSGALAVSSILGEEFVKK